MKLRSVFVLSSISLAALAVAALPQSARAQAVTVSTMVNFDGTNGDSPYAALTVGSDGNFYGTTRGNPDDRMNVGTAFKLTPSGALTTLVRFTRGSDDFEAIGGRPNGLVQGSDGNFYGTTHEGGTAQGPYSAGVAFSMTSSGALTVLHTFGGNLGRDANGNQIPDGNTVDAGLIQARDGRFYGTTSGVFNGNGTVFSIASSGAYAQLAQFHDPSGASPRAALLQASDGSFYGTTSIGNGGTVFKFPPGGAPTVLITFTGPNGAQPDAELIQATGGNFYGTTSRGGSSPDAFNSGTVFRLTPAGQLTTLANFNGTNGNSPKGALLQARDGNFYGTTYGGGRYNAGTVFKLTPAGVLTTLFDFNGVNNPPNPNNGSNPSAALIQGPNGDFYGTTVLGGSGGRGTVFGVNISPNTVQEKTLGNIATRLQVGTGDNALIGGFIVTGTSPKKVIVRGIGPSLTGFGVPGALADPILELHDGSGQLIASNDDWKDTNRAAIEASGIPPTNDLESAIVATLAANGATYTAILRGKNNTTGIGVVEAYDFDQTVDSRLGNISTRGFVNTGDNVMIGGFIVGPSTKVGVRGIGPSLAPFGITNPLQNPSLDLRDINGVQVAFNDNWKDSQQAEIQTAGLAPSDDRESALIQTLLAGPYTVTLRGVGNTTGIALFEAYNLH